MEEGDGDGLRSAEHSLPEDVVYSCLVAFAHVFQSGEHL